MVTKILTVDDDQGAREFYRFVLEDAGYTVQTAADATAAIALCEEFNPDLLLLDWDMPGGSGKVVYERILRLLGRTVPVLFVTGSPENVSVDLLSGRISVLQKPANIDTLLSHVEHLLI